MVRGAPAQHHTPLKSRFLRRDGEMVMEPLSDGEMPICDVPLPAPKGTPSSCFMDAYIIHLKTPLLAHAYALHMIDAQYQPITHAEPRNETPIHLVCFSPVKLAFGPLRKGGIGDSNFRAQHGNIHHQCLITQPLPAPSGFLS